MDVHEYSYEKHLQFEKDESYHDGYNTGFDSGLNAGHDNGIQDTNALYSWLRSNGRQSDIFIALDNPDYLAQLFEEYKKFKKDES